METCRRILISGLQSLNLNISKDKVELLLAFIKLIEKWNKAYNLTAVRNREEMVRLHLLDSLAIIPYLEGKRVIDIGTGAGLPGIPLAICLPETRFALLDSNAKKTRFVQQAVLELKLKNVEVCPNRVETYHPEKSFNTVIARAFAALPNIVKSAAHVLSRDGVLLAMKGRRPDSELEQLALKTTVIPIRVPGIEAERCLIRIQLPAKAEVSQWEK
ncbi:methyltransferase, SAM-dependent methyltransferase, glucose-inhibited cell-division protein [Candidatus Methylobacter favarea]|uniref:Ribosomal RNA small subunit methyltransferase G n=1 Tax=Candidatus Methylobacter favarea TaxID=2707345 RepID=A0A8S0XKZ3_9GAMM|nr:16S rRNA (guanine(527)-N(7))-methyltransferase RsmG [Candidatus Methylobacter favarea]CAA9892412.1 methyltransferase, SAM-dependent methyltransferase, glucose-inhibited cell-division protein [Candidatus Methylobacter favarea]